MTSPRLLMFLLVAVAWMPAPPQVAPPPNGVVAPSCSEAESRPSDARGEARRRQAKPRDAASPPRDAESLNDSGLTREQAEARERCNEAFAAFQEHDYARAMELATRSVALDDAYGNSIRLVGWCAAATGDDRKAEAALTRALNMNPADGELQFLLAGCHKRLQEWGAAKDLLQDLLKRDGPTLRVLLEMSECCLGDADHGGALAALESARDLAPDERAVVELRVDVRGSMGEWGRVAADLRALVARAPKEAPLRYRLVQALLNAQKLAEAAVELEETARAFADDRRPHELLESIYSGFLPNPARLEFHRVWLKERDALRR